MLVFGIALVACFVLPWSLAPDTRFSWNALSDAAGKFKLPPLLIAGSGVLAVILSRLPLSMSARGLAAALVGFTPVALQAFLLSQTPFMLSPAQGGPGGADIPVWQLAMLVLSALTLVSGLLLRSQYHTSFLPKLMVTAGAACLLLPLLLDEPSIIDILGELGNAPGKVQLMFIILLMPVVLAIVGLILAWLPTEGAAGTHVVAWLLIIWPLVVSLVLNIALVEAGMSSHIKANLYLIFWLPTVAVAWTALTGYGVAAFVGKSLEHR